MHDNQPIAPTSTTPYRKLKDYWHSRFGGRMQKISLCAGVTCPNRDGTLGTKGCLYCSNEAFIPGYCSPDAPLDEQIEQGLNFQSKRYSRAAGFLGYLQAYTNTYGPLDGLINNYETVLQHPRLSGLVIGTRPDCIPDSLLDWLRNAAKHKPIYIELGIESFSDDTLSAMNRGHCYQDAIDALERINEYEIPTGAHFLVGFPGEPWTMFFDSVDELNKLPIHSIKVHQLHVFKSTPLAQIYRQFPAKFSFPTKEDYFRKAAEWLTRLRPDIYIDRMFGDAPPQYVLNETWGIRMDRIVQEFDQYLQEIQCSQGSRYNLPSY